MQSLSIIQTIAVWIVPVLLAITLHEAAHAWVASCCGDTTAKALGRLSMNPFRHVDPIGTLFVPIVTAVLSGFHFTFGWAKPVPISWHRLRKPRRDMALVAIAGPLANLLMAFVWALYAKLGTMVGVETSIVARYMLLTGMAGIFINFVLAFLNLLPILPLDGGRILASLLPLKIAKFYSYLEPFGFLIVAALLFTGVLGWMISPPIQWAMHILESIFTLG